MSTTPPPQALTPGTQPATGEPAAREGAFGWLRALGPQGRRAFGGAFGGYGLDSYDYFTLPLSMVALAAYFGLDSGQTGLFTTVTLVVSAVGGAVAGVVADRIGRVKALMITVITYAVFTVACGFAPNYETLLVFRALQGLGFGGEWAVGAVLVAEYASPRNRGRTLGAVQSAWAVGWGLAVAVYTLVFQLLDDDLAWRVMFWTGALPALLVVWVRREVRDAPEAAAARERSAEKGSFAAIFRPGTAEAPGLLRTTFFAVLLSTGVQGGYYTLATWVPTYLKTERGLSVVGTGGYLTLLISGAFLGYLTGGLLTDRLGRKRNILLFAILSAACVLAYANIPSGANTLLLVLGFPSASACRRSSAVSARSSASCTRWRCAARDRASPTTPGVPSARPSPPRSASWPTAGASAGRWSSARSDTPSPRSP